MTGLTSYWILSPRVRMYTYASSDSPTSAVVEREGGQQLVVELIPAVVVGL